MKARPILFSTPMVKALLEGRKTQTRRVIKPQPVKKHFGMEWNPKGKDIYCVMAVNCPLEIAWYCPHGRAGDLLWVREAFGIGRIHHETTKSLSREVIYKADDRVEGNWMLEKGWKPSIFMPRSMSRLTLEIINVRTETLQRISEQSAIAEGFSRDWQPDTWGWHKFSARYNFFELWKKINAKNSVAENPWVWVIEFKVHKMNVDEYLKKNSP